MQCTAEVGAVECQDAYAIGNPFQRACFSGHNQQLCIVVAFDSETVWDIPFLFDVCYMEVNLIAHLNAFDVIGNETRTDGCHVDINAVAMALNTSFLCGADLVRIVVVLQ